MNNKELGPYLSIADVAELVGSSVSSVRRWKREDKTFPKQINLSRRFVVFRRDEVMAWVESKKT